MSHRTKRIVIENEQSSDEDELFSYLKTTHPIKPVNKVRRPIDNDADAGVNKGAGNGKGLDKRNLMGKTSKRDRGRIETAMNSLQNNSEEKHIVQHKTLITASIGPGYSDINAEKHGSGVNNLYMTTSEVGTADRLSEKNNGHADVNRNNPKTNSEHFHGIIENYQQDSCNFDGTDSKQQQQSKQDFKMGESIEKTNKESSDPMSNENKYYLINEKDWLSLCAKISDSEMQEHVEIADHETEQLGVSEFTGANSEKLETNSQVMNTSPVTSTLNTSPVKSPIHASPRGAAAMFNLFKQHGSVSNAAQEVSFIRSPVNSKSDIGMKVDQQNSPTESHTSSTSDNVTRHQYNNVVSGRSKTKENNTTPTTPKVEIVYIRLEDGQIKYDDMNLPIGTTESKYDSSPQAAVKKLDFCEDSQVNTVRNEEREISQSNDLPNTYIDQHGHFVMQSVLNSACPNPDGAPNVAISGGQSVHGRFVRINNKLTRVFESIEDEVLAVSQEVYHDKHIPVIGEDYDENDSFNFDDSRLVAYPLNAIDPDMITDDSLTLLTPSKLDLLDNIDINLSPEKPVCLNDGSSSESPIVLKVTRSGELVPCRGSDKRPVQKMSTHKRHIATGEYGVVKDQGAHIRSLWKNFKPQNSGKCAHTIRSHIAASEDSDCEITNNVEDKGGLSSDEDDLVNYFKQKNLTDRSSESSKASKDLAKPLKGNVSNAVASTSNCSISIQASFTDSEDESNNVEIVRTKRTIPIQIFQNCPYKQVNFKDFDSEVDLEAQLKEKIKTKKANIKTLELKATGASNRENSACRFKDKVEIDLRTKHYDEVIAATVNRVYENEHLMKEKLLTDSDEAHVCNEMAPTKRPNKLPSDPDKQVSWKDKTDICVEPRKPRTVADEKPDVQNKPKHLSVKRQSGKRVALKNKTDICVDHRKPRIVAEGKPDVQNKPKNLVMKRQSGKRVALKNLDRSLIANDTKEVKQTNTKVNELKGKHKGKKSQIYEQEITHNMTRGKINTERIEHNSINTKIDATCTTNMIDEETSLNSVKANKINFLEKLFHVKLKEAAIDASNSNKGQNRCLNSCESSMEELSGTNNLTECANAERKRPRGRPRKDASTVFKRIKAVSAENTRKTSKTESKDNRICANLKGDKPANAQRYDNRQRKHENTDKASAVDANMKTVPQFDKTQITELRCTDSTKKQGVSFSDKDAKVKNPRGRPRLSTNNTKSKNTEMKLGRKEISNAEDKSSHPDTLIVKRPRGRPTLKNGRTTRLNVNSANREMGSEESQKRNQPKTPHKTVKIKGRKHDSSRNTDVEDISYLGKFQTSEERVTKIIASKRKRTNNENVVRWKSQKIDSGINESDANGKITPGNDSIKRKGRKRKSFGLGSDELEVINDVILSLPKEKHVGQDSSSGNKTKRNKSEAPFSKQLRDGKEIKQSCNMKKTPGSLKSAKKPISRIRLKAKRHANDSWKDMLEDKAFKFDFDERINEEHRPVNVRRMIRKILKSTKVSDNTKVVKVKHRERKDKLRQRSYADARLRMTSESDDAWLSDSGPSASFPAFKFAGIDDIVGEIQPENYIPLKKTSMKELSWVEDSSRKELKGRKQSDDKSRQSESRLVKQTVPTGNDINYMELHHSPLKDVGKKVQQEFKQGSSAMLENPSDTMSDPIDTVGNAKGSPEVNRNVNRLIALLDKVVDKKTVDSLQIINIRGPSDSEN